MSSTPPPFEPPSEAEMETLRRSFNSVPKDCPINFDFAGFFADFERLMENTKRSSEENRKRIAELERRAQERAELQRWVGELPEKSAKQSREVAETIRLADQVHAMVDRIQEDSQILPGEQRHWM